MKVSSMKNLICIWESKYRKMFLELFHLKIKIIEINKSIKIMNAYIIESILVFFK